MLGDKKAYDDEIMLRTIKMPRKLAALDPRLPD
jgi:hypothetical protein